LSTHAFLLGNGQTYTTLSVPYYRVSRIFMSCNFHPCKLVPQIHVSHFPPLQHGAAFSCPANSCLAFSASPTQHFAAGDLACGQWRNYTHRQPRQCRGQGPKTVKGAQSDPNYVSRLLLDCVANVCREGGAKIIVTPQAVELSSSPAA